MSREEFSQRPLRSILAYVVPPEALLTRIVAFWAFYVDRRDI